MTRIVTLFAIAMLAACGGSDDSVDIGDIKSSLEAELESNTDWPYETVGVLDIIEAGFDGNSEYAQWGVGSLLTDDDDEWGVPITLEEGVAARARVDIDSGQEVRVWLEPAREEHGFTSYPVVKMEKL